MRISHLVWLQSYTVITRSYIISFPLFASMNTEIYPQQIPDLYCVLYFSHALYGLINKTLCFYSYIIFITQYIGVLILLVLRISLIKYPPNTNLVHRNVVCVNESTFNLFNVFSSWTLFFGHGYLWCLLYIDIRCNLEVWYDCLPLDTVAWLHFASHVLWIIDVMAAHLG